jgi:hypothetical protein
MHATRAMGKERVDAGVNSNPQEMEGNNSVVNGEYPEGFSTTVS